LLPVPEAAAKGLLGRMYNTLAAQAQFENICLMDDDIILTDGWYAKLVESLKNRSFDVVSFPIKNTDGSRFWDWVAWQPGWEAPALLPYNQTSPDQYVTGGMVLLRRAVWEVVKWSDSLGFYQQEDHDWSRRVWAAGFRLCFCPSAFVLHNDWRYYRKGIGIAKHTNLQSALTDLPSSVRETEDQYALIAQRNSLLTQVATYRQSTSYKLGRFLLSPVRFGSTLLQRVKSK
jgi:hypothetical protein